LKIIITGAGGLVGRAMISECAGRGDEVVALEHHALDIGDAAAVKETIAAQTPDVVINCAAWTDVDGCESDRERAFRDNALGPEFLALACRSSGALLITLSTDYVFAGTKAGFYTQRDQPSPRSVYAASKLEGERRAQTVWSRTMVVRSGYIFGTGGANFLSTFVESARAGRQLKVINDMFGTPTYAPHLARRLYELALIDLPGIYHVVNAGEGVSFADFALEAFEITGLDPALLETVASDSLRRPAARPQNSRLECLLSAAIGLPPMADWRAALREFVAS
jgi:dTDP-4-dehydrorhamnose reductase